MTTILTLLKYATITLNRLLDTYAATSENISMSLYGHLQTQIQYPVGW